jgi:hypothetical protein
LNNDVEQGEKYQKVQKNIRKISENIEGGENE